MRTKHAWIASFALATFVAPAAFAGSLKVQAPTGAVVAIAAGDHLDITVAPKAESVAGDSAVITWTTSAQASATVKYGTDRNNLDRTKQGAWGGPEHRVTINGLKPGTLYYFQVVSTEGKNTGTGAIGKVDSFTTGSATPAGVTVAPASGLKIIDGPKTESLTGNSAQIAWSTNVESSAIVRYGTDANKLDQTAAQAWGGSKTATSAVHRVELKNLKPSTTYFYQVESGQGRGVGQEVKSGVQSIRTPDTASAQTTTPPAQSGMVNDQVSIQAGPVAQNVTDKSAVLWWMTSGHTRSVVKYGKDKNNLTETAQAAAGDEHRVQLNNLEAGTTYFFQLMSHDGLKRAEGQFKTEGADFAQRKFRITNGPVIEMVSQDSAVIAWSTNARSSSTVRYGTDPNNLNLTAQAPWGQETHRVVVRNLKPQTKYYFAVESSQAEGTGLNAKSNISPFSTVNVDQQAMHNPDGR